MKPLVLHIGPHKTGSSTIQQFLVLNEAALRAAGVNFLRAGRKFPNQNGNLAFEIAKPRNYLAEQSGWKEALEELDEGNYHRHVISSEAFSHFKPEHIARLHDLIGRFDVKIVFYARRPDGWVESSYVQQLKQLTTCRTPDAFIGRKLDESLIVRPASLLAMWAERFGREAISLRVLETGQLVGGDLVTDFCAAAGLDGTSLETAVELRNPAPGPKTIDALFHVSNDRKRKDPHAPMHRPVKLGMRVRKYGKKRGWDAARARIVPGDLALAICDRFRDEQAKAARRFLGRPDGALFHEAPTGGGGATATLPGLLTVEERAEMMASLELD